MAGLQLDMVGIRIEFFTWRFLSQVSYPDTKRPSVSNVWDNKTSWSTQFVFYANTVWYNDKKKNLKYW